MDVCIRPGGDVFVVYNEVLDLTDMGLASIHRASHVEPDACGRWWADLAPVGGPRLGPFLIRSQALDAESTWLQQELNQIRIGCRSS